MDIDQIRATSIVPEITIVRGHSPSSLLAHHALMDHLAVMQQTAKHPALILIEFGRAAAHDPDELAGVLEQFPDPLRVELAWGTESAAAAVAEAFAKLIVSEREGCPRSFGKGEGGDRGYCRIALRKRKTFRPKSRKSIRH